MPFQTLPLFFHPSTVVLIDDEVIFLNTIASSIETGAGCREFSDPKEALAYLNSLPLVHPLFQEKRDPNREFLIDPKKLERFVADANRFDWVTTVIVDYTMPNMNGLELCKKLKSPYIRKIMLTGDAGLDVAIEALNAGIIHKFFRKSDPRLIQVLNEAIHQAQLQYFGLQSQRFYDGLPNKADIPSWFQNQSVVEFIVSEIQKVQTREFYALNEQGDILLFNRQGELYFLLVRDEKGMASLATQAEFAYNSEPDPESLSLLKAIQKGELMLEPITLTQMQSSLDDWRNYLHSAQYFEIEGHTYYYSLFPVHFSHLENYLETSLSIKSLPYSRNS